MAKRIKFPLILKGVPCRTLEELKKNFDIKEMVGYFHDKKLLKWLNDRGLDEEAEKIERLSEDDPNFQRQLGSFFEVEISEEIDTEEEVWRQERINRLKQYTDDQSILNKVDQVAFDQEELGDRLNENLDEIILVNNNFRISTKRGNKIYIGVGKVIASIKSDTPIDFDSLNIKFVNINFDENYTAIPNNKTDNSPISSSVTIKEVIEKLTEAIKLLESSEIEIANNDDDIKIMIDNLHQLEESKDKLKDILNKRIKNVLNQFIKQSTKNNKINKIDARDMNEIGDFYKKVGDEQRAHKWYRKAERNGAPVCRNLW